MSTNCFLLSKVYVTDAVVQNCLAHAFSSEKEEVMGVLMGDVMLSYGVPSAQEAASSSSQGSASSSKVAHVWSSYIMERSVRRSDRVEVAAETLIRAAEEAERLTERLKRKTRVIGWYHSHPRITPFPSAVDLHSQQTYQQMESGWVGLIFSVFHTDSANRNNCSIHCFQTGPNNTHVKVPLEVVAPPTIQIPMHFQAGGGPQDMLRVFEHELDSAVEFIKERSSNDAMAMRAARGLQEAQLFTLERLVAEPVAKYCQWSSIPVLENEIKRLERELASL